MATTRNEESVNNTNQMNKEPDTGCYAEMRRLSRLEGDLHLLRKNSTITARKCTARPQTRKL